MKRIGLYTKEVIKHFKNPHNMGRIKNPDGVGKAGNIVCLLPEEKIHTDYELKAISEISGQEKVLSHDGIFHRIKRIVKREYSGKILQIKNKLGTISLTPDHLLLAIKIPKENKFLRTKNKKRLSPAWYHAYQLKKGDIILYPVLKKVRDLKYIEFDIPKPKWDFKSKNLPKKIPLNSDFLRLAGYFLSEGNVEDKPCRTFLIFTLNIKEKEIANDIKRISKKLFGLDAVLREIPERRTLIVYLYSARLARFFKKLFLKGAENKEIPDFIMDLPVEKQRPLIEGLWKGDGYVNLNRNGPRGGYSTISFKLAQQIKLLLLRQKIGPSIYIDKEKNRKGVFHQKAYRIHVGQRKSLINLCSILGLNYIPKSYQSEDDWFDENYFYTPITEIKEKKYRGKVYNLEIVNSHSFTSESFCLHNCGDVMWLYIKVGKDKKGREIIKDVKFETYGCVAAIATSSVITDLVRGKPLEEALEFNREEIVKELGGLPPIKLHCSVLAADALFEAIYDYFKKQKREIPEKLLKAHQKIEKDKKEIEKRYKEWTKIEEKMRKK
jgi:nitrogen fixation NifU-like protein